MNIRYLTGFTGSAARLVLQPGEPAVLVTDGRYEDQAAQELAGAGVGARVAVGRSQQAQRDVLEEVLGRVPRVGLEAAHVTWADQQGYAQLFARSELVPTVGLVEERRVVKDDGELARLQRAADIAGEALANVLGLLDDEPTEADFALALDSEMRRLGASGPELRDDRRRRTERRPAPPPSRRPSHPRGRSAGARLRLPRSTATTPT